MYEDNAAALRSKGLHATVQRIAILDDLAKHPHSDADAVLGRVGTQLGAISKQAVYDALSALVEHGLLRRIQPIGASALYEDRVDDNHHHVICRLCGAIGDVDCAVGEAPCLEASQTYGFTIDEADVVYWGLCPTCTQQGLVASRLDPQPARARSHQHP
jgi:Fur family ferric uptake transcriptional regulator